MIKNYMGQVGLRSKVNGVKVNRSIVTWVKVIQKAFILAGGVTSTSSCLIYSIWDLFLNLTFATTMEHLTY